MAGNSQLEGTALKLAGLCELWTRFADISAGRTQLWLRQAIDSHLRTTQQQQVQQPQQDAMTNATLKIMIILIKVASETPSLQEVEVGEAAKVVGHIDKQSPSQHFSPVPHW